MRLILTRGSDQSLRAFRVKFSSGSFNAVRGRELFFGDEGDRVDDNTRGRDEKARRKKLNDESPFKGFPVRTRRDATEQRKSFADGYGSACRVGSQKWNAETSSETAPSREVWTYGKTTRPRKPLATPLRFQRVLLIGESLRPAIDCRRLFCRTGNSNAVVRESVASRRKRELRGAEGEIFHALELESSGAHGKAVMARPRATGGAGRKKRGRKQRRTKAKSS